MDKLKLAHSYMVEYVKKNGLDVSYFDVSAAFDIAEAMLAENAKRTDKTRPEVLDEFQVDWSKAPDWANWWLMQSDGSFHFVGVKPFFDGSLWFTRTDVEWLDAPSFNYQGDWKDSLQERK